MRLSGRLVGLATVGLAACGAADAPPMPTCDPLRGPPMPQFLDVTKPAGITFQYATPDFKAGGLAVADLDGDGRPDILATRRIGGLALYHNRGGMRFTAVADSGLDPNAAINAIAAADLDNDGDLDLVLAGSGTAFVMANQGDGTFVEAARFTDSGKTEHVLAADLDGDGLLDLYFGNYDLDHLASAANRLYMNRGGLAFAPAVIVGSGMTWSTTALDVDGDGDQDLYVANDTLLADFGHPVPGQVTTSNLPSDLLLRNDGVDANGVPQFTDIAASYGLTTPRSSMGGLLGDFDDDGRLDLYVPNEGAKKLFLREADGGMRESAAQLGVAGIGRANATCGPDTTDEDCLLLSWGAALSDFDLDGFDELLVVNGETVLGQPPPVLMFARGPELPFHEVSPSIACLDARGLIVTDLDGDGDQDVVISQKEGPLVVYQNIGTPATGRWLDVTLHGHTSNRQGVGAVVTLHHASGRTQMRVVGHGGVINSSGPAEAFFGLGRDPIDSVDVQWPSGRHSSVIAPSAGALVIDEP